MYPISSIKPANPTVIVLIVTLLVMTRANTYSVHPSMNVKVAVADKPGAATGKITLNRAPILEQPSIMADSSNSCGILLKYPVSIHVEKGKANAVYVKIKPWKVSSILNLNRSK